MFEFDAGSRSPRRLAGWAALIPLLFASAGAQAHAPRDGWRRMLEKDAAEAVGGWIEGRILRKKLERLQGAGAFGDPRGVRETYRAEDNYADAFGLPAGLAAAAGFMLGSAGGGTIYSEKGWGFWKTGGAVSGTTLAVSAGVFIIVAGAKVASVASTGGTSRESGGGEESIEFSLRPQAVRNRQADAVEAANAERQAAFVNGLKKVSLEIASRLATLLAVPESARPEFERTVEQRVLAEFRAPSKWDANTAIRIDVAGIVTSLLEDAEARLELLDRAVVAGQKTRTAPRTANEARTAYDTLVAEAESLAREAAETQRALEASIPAGSPLATAAQELRRFASAQESRVEKLKLHQKLLR